MKIKIKLLFLGLLIFSSNILAERLFLHLPQSENIFSDTLKNKSASLKDTTIKKIKKEILLPLKNPSLLEQHSNNSILSKEKLSTIDYRTTADYFRNVPFGFVRDLGSVGLPNETLIYGNGSGNVSFLSNGIPINNRLSNSLDLNLFQSESVDSVEIIPLTRGFLFANQNNLVSVNFISREPDIRKPFSRLKYYQGPNSEGLLNGIFNITPFSKFNAYIEISNQSTKPYYKNTDYSNWSGTARLRYLLSKSINLIASYRYVKSIIQLNGGVDADSIKSRFSSFPFNDILYDNFRAPVRFTNRYQKVAANDFKVSMLANSSENSSTDLSFYYQSGLTEFRQNEPQDKSGIEYIFNNNKYSTIGGNLRQDFNFYFGRLTSITNYEKSKYTLDSLTWSEETNRSYFSTTAIASFNLLNDLLKPSLFGKYTIDSEKNYVGFGADATFKPNNSIELYWGLSIFEKPLTFWEEKFALGQLKKNKQKISSIEFSASFRNNNLKATVGYFNQTSSNRFIAVIDEQDKMKTSAFYGDVKNLSLQGLSLKLDLKVWKILFSTSTSYYFNKENRNDYKLPKFTSNGGIYYIDTLFNHNLKLKTGINYFSIGERNQVMMDFEKNISFNKYYNTVTPPPTSILIPGSFSPSFQIDFFLAGRIQDRAVVYFVFENLLDAKYFIVPYYPKQPRGLRFGVAWEFLD